jgi:methyltransferase (TIGR00027 family)
MSLTGVSKTALGVARIRAGESRRPGRLFDDPYAAAFVAAMPQAYAEEAERSDARRAVVAALVVHVIIRTRFYDDYLGAATHAGCRQVVLLAAGLDTRAFRLDWPAGVRLFEIDLPDVLAFKDRVLTDQDAQSRCDRTAIGADLTGDWPASLARAGFRPDRPAAWLVEGLLVYLTATDAGRLLTEVSALAAPGSRLSCEQGRSVAQLATATSQAGATEATSLWQGGLGDETMAFLEAKGWETQSRDLRSVAADYGHSVAEGTTSGFVTARRRPTG